MRYALLMHHAEPAPGEIPQEEISAVQDAFDAYGEALASAGVLVGADVLGSPTASTTVTQRSGSLQIQDGPFAETKEALAGIFLLEVPDLDAALAWAEKCPGAGFGVLEVRPVATSFVNGSWT